MVHTFADYVYLNHADRPGKWYKLSSVDLLGEMHELFLSTEISK